MTGDGSDTTLTLSTSPVNENATFVTIDGVLQHKDTYAISGNTLTFSEAPPNGSKVESITLTATSSTTANILSDADSDTKIQVEESSDEDNIRFDTGGTERAVIDSSGLTVGDITINGSTISDGADLTVDVGGDIILDAAGQQIFFTAGGTNVGQIDMAGTDLELKSLVSNADLFIRGNDGGSEITALTFDMSDAGFATFNSGVTINGSSELVSTAINFDFMETGVTDSNHRIRQNAGNLVIQKLSDDKGTSTDRIHLDGSTGNVGIGTTSPTAPLYVVGNAVVTGNIISTGDTNIIYDSDDNFIVSTANGTERMRVTNSGTLLVTTNTASGLSNTNSNYGHSFGGGQQVNSTNNDVCLILNRSLGSGEMVTIRNNGSTVGSISQNGSATAFNTSSDYRLKENVNYTWDATTRLKQLKPARFNFIADDTNTLVDGFLAHEVSSIVPEAITGEKDGAEMQGIDQSKLVPLLVKTIQELEARITTLEG